MRNLVGVVGITAASCSSVVISKCNVWAERQVQPGPGPRFPLGSVASPCWTVFSLRVRRTRIADIASDPVLCQNSALLK